MSDSLISVFQGNGAMWYSATLVFRSKISGEASIRPLCEERVMLFKANSELQARKAAERFGRREAHSYLNVAGETVSWEFAGIDEFQVLDSPAADGWEIRARFVRRSWSTLRKLAKGRNSRVDRPRRQK
jgi:hypothetical protein